MWRFFSDLWDRVNGAEEERREELVALWEAAKEQHSGDISQEFLALLASEEGWSISWMARKIIAHESEDAENFPGLFGLQHSQQIEMPVQREAQPEWLADLLEYPSILVWGPQGSGKSTLAEWVIYERLKTGHKIEILDPHRKAGQWQNLPCYGDGLDYEAIDARLAAFADEVRRRYTVRSQQENVTFDPYTVLAEEFTNWAFRCKSSGGFFACALSDIRKINCHAIFVSHARTLPGLGGAKGMAATRDASLLEIELSAKLDPETRKAVPTGKGKLKYPDAQPITVSIPKLTPNYPQALGRSGSEEFDKISEFGNVQKQPILEVRSRFWLVALLRAKGVSDSEIIKEGLRFKGDKYSQGKLLLESLDNLARKNGW